jgi:hypothetical protein
VHLLAEKLQVCLDGGRRNTNDGVDHDPSPTRCN